MTKREVLQRIIAGMLDHPSVYMGGPSQGNRRRAGRIVEMLEDEGYVGGLADEYVIAPPASEEPPPDA